VPQAIILDFVFLDLTAGHAHFTRTQVAHNLSLGTSYPGAFCTSGRCSQSTPLTSFNGSLGHN